MMEYLKSNNYEIVLEATELSVTGGRGSQPLSFVPCFLKTMPDVWLDGSGTIGVATCSSNGQYDFKCG